LRKEFRIQEQISRNLELISACPAFPSSRQTPSTGRLGSPHSATADS
jgi:hypothetical protein